MAIPPKVDRSRSLVSKATSTLTLVENAFAILAGVIVAAMALGITVDVIGRTWLGFSFPQTVQLSEYGMLAITFLPAAWILRQSGHVWVDVVTNAMPLRMKKELLQTIMVLGLAVCAVAAVLSIAYVRSSLDANITQYGVVTVPRWIVHLPLPIGFTLLTLEFVRQLVGGRTRREQTS